jgi:hypothetical protein
VLVIRKLKFFLTLFLYALHYNFSIFEKSTKNPVISA